MIDALEETANLSNAFVTGGPLRTASRRFIQVFVRTLNATGRWGSSALASQATDPMADTASPRHECRQRWESYGFALDLVRVRRLLGCAMSDDVPC